MDTAKKVNIARTITKTIVGACVASTVTAIIKDHVDDEDSTRINQVKIYIATWALSGIAASMAVDYAEKKFNKSVGTVVDIVTGTPTKPTTTQ